jgi:hypothetical protein
VIANQAADVLARSTTQSATHLHHSNGNLRDGLQFSLIRLWLETLATR